MAVVALLGLWVTHLTTPAHAAESTTNATTADGYRGIWFTLGQRSEHGDKYSGGLGTYTANHNPIAIYSRAANKTFFVYGGTRAAGERHLLIMASYYDHATGAVPRPTIVHDKKGVNDPHDNGAIAIDAEGYVWVFVSGRARIRPGFIYRATKPYSVEAFERVVEDELTYPQPKHIPGKGFFYLHTKYTAGRELYWQTSADGRTWSEAQKLAGFGGHYQVTATHGETIGSAFMWHPGGSVDKRTNLYYAQTTDFGKSWTTAAGAAFGTPLASERNPALLIDYQAQKLNVYIHDLNFDQHGHPAILYLTSKGHEPGPENGRRIWRVTSFDGKSWRTSSLGESDHNYDTGCLFIDGDRWTVVGPTLPGPQPQGTGGEIVEHLSEDGGKTWLKTQQITRDSKFNHSYVRRVVDGVEPFHMFWADGNPDKLSESHLYFGSYTSGKVFGLPYEMPEQSATPTEILR